MGLLSGGLSGSRLAIALAAAASLAVFAIGLGIALDRGLPASPGIAVEAPDPVPAEAPQAQAGPDPAGGLPGLEVMVARLEGKLSDGSGTADQWKLLGQTYLELGRTAEARRAFDKAATLEVAGAPPANPPR